MAPTYLEKMELKRNCIRSKRILRHMEVLSNEIKEARNLEIPIDGYLRTLRRLENRFIVIKTESDKIKNRLDTLATA